MAITFRFVNRNTNAEGIRVYKSATSFESNTLPSVLRTIPADATEFVDPDVSRGETYFYMFETFLGEDSAFSPLVYAEALPTETGPGPQVLLPGSDNWTGFFGEIPAQEFITGTALANHFGLTDGTVLHDDAPWLKFVYDGKVLFVAQKPLRRSITWDAIHAKNLVYGDRVIEVQGDLYSVRLLRGADVDPTSAPEGYDPVGTSDSEWNRLIYNVHNGEHTDPNNTTPPGQWPLYSDADLVVHRDTGYGSRSWCQETNANDGNQRVARGGNGVSYLGFLNASGQNLERSWRPVLELLRHRDKFLGEVPVTDLINGDELASKIGLTAGIAQHSNEPWLKFMTREGKTLYVAKKPFRHTITWNNINTAGAVFGSSVVYINGRNYKVRLLKGTITDPTSGGSGYHDPENTWDSEWNRLFYPLVPNPTNKPDSGISGEGLEYGSWASYTEADLVVRSGNGRATWCQESSGTYRVTRGLNSLSHLYLNNYTSASANYGWRPVLELIET